jgi:L-threonylcarbamoyladenylate synthase
MQRQPDFFSKALAGGNTVALRAPAYGLVRDIAHVLGEPITGTSANRSGGRPVTTAQEIAFQLGQMVDLVIDGGPVQRGVESTIIDITTETSPVILREGSIPAAEIQAAAGVPITLAGSS